MNEGVPRSIGEVLDLLKDEFADITISKIRFLEGQGLLQIERTASGYRKFHAEDIERLRWILRQQREHFLPLKVIRERLEGDEGGSDDAEPTIDLTEPAPTPVSTSGPVTAAPSGGSTATAVAPAPTTTNPPVTTPEPAPVAASTNGGTATGEGRCTEDELLEASDLDVPMLRELERFGLVGGTTVAGTVEYDEDALAVAKAVAGFTRHGLETRHLRSYLTAATREADLYGQVVMPMLRQRAPSSRRRAAATLDELARLGEELRTALLRRAVREQLGRR